MHNKNDKNTLYYKNKTNFISASLVQLRVLKKYNKNKKLYIKN